MCVGCLGVSVSSPAPGHGCQCRSGATVWQLQDPGAPAAAGAAWTRSHANPEG